MSFERARTSLVDTRFADLRWVSETGSTNADMLGLLAERGGTRLATPIVLLADHQHSGRGRLDRSWTAPAGSSVLMTIGLPVGDLPIDRRTLLTTCLALSVTDVLGSSVSPIATPTPSSPANNDPSLAPTVRIKWPNDLVVDSDDGRFGYLKVGGILAEVHDVTGVGVCVLLGIGLNVNWPSIPADLSGTATALNHLAGHEVDREDLVAATLRSLDAVWLPLIESATGDLGALDAAYAARSATIGRRVRIELDGDELRGVATGVTATGALTVEDDAGTLHTVTVGDVVHLRPED